MQRSTNINAENLQQGLNVTVFMSLQGALFGSVIGVVLSLWIGLGAILFGPSAIDDNLAVGQCLPVNYTSALLDNNITQRNTTMAMTTGTLEQSM